MRKSLWKAAIAISTIMMTGAFAADIAELERQLEQARKEAPITVAPFVAVSKPAEYFGGYEPRKDAVYAKGETMHFYAEPKNLIYPKNAKGMYQPAFDVDLEVTGPDGKQFKQPKFASFKLDTRSRLQDLFLNLDVSLSQAPAGKYNVKFVINDRNSKKTTAFGQEITIK
jgi:hypothetical protein